MEYFSWKEFQLLCKVQNMHESPQENDRMLLQKAQNILRNLAWVPGIKMIAVANSVAMHGSTPASDIDLFVVTERKRMWLVRVLLTLFMEVKGERKTSKKHAGKFCLSFFCTENHLDFASIALERDIYLYFWILMLKPIIEYDHTYERFLEAQSWADFWEYPRFFAQFQTFTVVSWKSKHYSWWLQRLFDIGDFLCKMMVFPKTWISARKKKSVGIVIGKDMLKFHDVDRRASIAKSVFGLCHHI